MSEICPGPVRKRTWFSVIDFNYRGKYMSKNNEILNPNSEKSPFEKIKKINEYGQEFWSSRALSKLLEYA